MSTAFAAAGIFVLPTLADDWAVVVQEALAAGLPILGSIYSAAVADLIADGENGWRFAPDDAESVHAALNRALTTDETELVAMRRRARESGRRPNNESVAAEVARAIEYSMRFPRVRKPVS
jgi:glycosyltransferase involved in cell wall biosynthesis